MLIPYRSGDEWREQARKWVRKRFRRAHPDWPIIEGDDGGPEFSRSGSILTAADKTDADILVITDGDVWTEWGDAIAALESSAWAIPHLLVHRLSPESTLRVLDGGDWHGQPLSRDNHQDRRPYAGHEAGTALAIRAEAFRAAPPDPRFRGWGQEDAAWSAALRTLVGPPWRGVHSLVHLWHPPEQRMSRVKGNPANVALATRYRLAKGDTVRMSALIEEARCLSSAS